MMNEFWLGFIKGARETPRAFFAPAVAIWRLLLNTTESLLAGHPQDKTNGENDAHAQNHHK
jgi:hypothetical protein